MIRLNLKQSVVFGLFSMASLAVSVAYAAPACPQPDCGTSILKACGGGAKDVCVQYQLFDGTKEKCVCQELNKNCKDGYYRKKPPKAAVSSTPVRAGVTSTIPQPSPTPDEYDWISTCPTPSATPTPINTYK